MKKTNKYSITQMGAVNRKKVFVVIPAYLEQPSIRQVIDELHREGYENIIVVDDGSPDNTYAEAHNAGGIYLLQHMVNRGKGAAMRTGFEAAKKLGAEIAVAFDGDGQHDARDIQNLIKKIAEGYDVVLGTRMKDSRGMPFVKQIANIIGNMVTWMLFGIFVSDSQSGLRAFSRKALDLIDTKGDRYTYETEVLKEIARNKLSVCEIPIRVIYTKHSQSKAVRQGFVTGLKTLVRLIISI